MWHRFSPDLKDAILCAARCAAASGGCGLSTGHLLTALVAEPDSPVVQILARLNITPEIVHQALASQSQPETCSGEPDLALTHEARAAVDRCYHLALELGDSYIGGEHLMLAFAREPHASDAGRSLEGAGATWDRICRGLMAVQAHRLHPPNGVSVPGLYARRLRRAALGATWRFQRLFRILPRLNQPFAPYFFTRERIKSEPYDFYARLRRRPLYFDTLIQHWVATGYDEVAGLLAESRFSHTSYAEPTWQSDKLPPVVDREFCRLEGTVRRQMLFMDAPQHTRLRGVVAREFTPTVIARMREQVQQVTDEFLDAGAKKGRMDIVADFAEPLPIVIIARMLAVPEDQIARFKRWTEAYFAFIAGETGMREDLAAYESICDLSEFFRALLPERRERPGTDLISLLLNAGDDTFRLTDEDVIANCFVLLAGGNETTTRLIGNGMLALFNSPDQFHWLRNNPSQCAAAVEELLRFDSPIQWTDRIATESFTWRDRKFEKGERVLIGLAAANRDPAQFPDPDRLDLSRSRNRHLAFGNGPHFCLGSALARLEGQIAFETLIRRFPRLRLDGDPIRPHSALTFRGLGSLPVRLD